MDLSYILAAVIALQFAYIVMLDRQHLAERKDLYNRIQGVREVPAGTPRGGNPIHRAVDPELDEKLKRDGIYQ